MGVINRTRSGLGSIRGARFGWVLSGESGGPDLTFDRDFGSSTFAAITPSKGAIVPEWLLIVPRERCASIAELSPTYREHVWQLAETAAEAVHNAVSKRAVIFEHGAAEWGSAHGCGVDQAHLHVVGLNDGFIPFVVDRSRDLRWEKCISLDDAWTRARGMRDYLLMVLDNDVWLAEANAPVSQFFRRHVAAYAQNAAQWDYKAFPQHENGLATCRLFARSFT